jgi:hypothetical protein
MAKRFSTADLIKLLGAGQDYMFYNSRGWRNLANEIKREQNNECQLCKARGRVGMAQIVHHVKHLRERPDLAYSRYFTDESGLRQRQLLAVCFLCHEEVHGITTMKEKTYKRYSNEERW